MKSASRCTRIFLTFMAVILSSVLLLSSCGEERTDERDTGEPTASVTASETVSKPVTEPVTERGTEVPEAPEVYDSDRIPPEISSCEGLTTAGLSRANWSTPFGGELTVESGEDGKYLRFTGIGQSWHSPAYNLYPCIGKSGTYTVSFRYMAEGNIPAGIVPFHVAIRGTRENDFMQDNGGNVYVNMLNCPACVPGTWYEASFTFYVSDQDIKTKDTWNLCFHMIDASVTALCVDDLAVRYIALDDAEPYAPTEAQTWVMGEMVFNAGKEYANPVGEQELDLILSCGTTEMTVPGFWDGGKTWRVRFALPEAGNWTWKTVCTDASDAGLHGQSGSLVCTDYDGTLAVYRHGFPTISDENRYFTYADGTPFLYLGDTHWTMFTEEFDEPGDHAGNTGAESHFRYLADLRAEQGFTVYQSEPIGSGIHVVNGITEADVISFRNMDRYFGYLADLGLVHANSQFFYPSDMVGWMEHETFEEELRIAARYWVARYSAYPVLWTLGQEVDLNFYDKLPTRDNPYLKLCEFLNRYDPLHHPITAHQENTGSARAGNSTFRQAEGHAWYAAQWSPALSGKIDFSVPKDYWENGQGKPVILYESLYDYLWTNHYGARAEGWIAFLNGMYGYGYGAIDIWYYHSTYDVGKPSTNHGITVSAADKEVPWSESSEFESARQVGYMRRFLSGLDWWRLTPRFDDPAWVVSANNSMYSVASDGNDVYLVYLYGTSNRVSSVTLRGLDTAASYTLLWFNPRTGEDAGTVTVRSSNGSFDLPEKPDREDWVLLLRKDS